MPTRPTERLARALLRAVLLTLLVAGAARALPPGDDFGAGITLDATQPLSQVMAEPTRHTEDAVLVRARISDVCQRKGCWTILRDEDTTVRVRFADYGFFLPKDVSGREALVEGRVTIRTMSEREARHFAEETKGGRPEEIHGPQQEVGFVATGVRILP
ncbi:MAG: DUF4920 domain-containing protein [bacterium]|nr:DUF4920 domain-containing protein [bacterium]